VGWPCSSADAASGPSGHTQAGINSGIQRAFNWAVGVRLIKDNPFRGFRLDAPKTTAAGSWSR
jgi:hypothetical protein